MSLYQISSSCNALRISLSTTTGNVDFLPIVKDVVSLLEKNTFHIKSSYEKISTTLEQIHKILNAETYWTNSQNQYVPITLNTLINEISKEHFHQNVNTNDIHVVFSKKNIKTASCDFHEESLLEHSLMAMIIAIDTSSDEDTVLSGLTALLHDIGKPACLSVYGKNIGYPFHGEYGACILSTMYSDAISIYITQEQWQDMCDAISLHMCSYHTTKNDEWSIYRRTLAQLPSPSVKKLLWNLSFGDTLGKFSNLSDSSAFLASREDYARMVNQPFDVSSFMKKEQKKTLCFFIRGKSCGGKSTFVKKLTDYLASFGFQDFQYDLISRDEIICETVAKRIIHTLTQKRPVGDEYKMLYSKYQELKLGKVVNDEIKKRISIAISQDKIPIVDSCILYYENIIQCIPTNISNAFIIAIDCVRNTPLTEADAHKNGMNFDTFLSTESEFIRTPIKWINTKKMFLEKLASISTNSKKPDTTFTPHLTFAYGFNQTHSFGLNSMKMTLEPILKYFSSTLKSANTSIMQIIEYVNYLQQNLGYDGMRNTLGEQYYRCSNSHGDDRILRMNYLDHNNHWKEAWNRQTRGTTFFQRASGIWTPIKFLLQRGAEMVTGIQVSHGVTSTESMSLDESCSYDEQIAKASSSILHLDDTQQKIIMSLLMNREIEDGMTLSFKKDGSLLGYTIFQDKEIAEYMRNFIQKSEDKFAQTIMKICDTLSLPFGVFSSQSTLLIGENMLDWTIQALCSTLMNDDKIIERFSGKTYYDAIDECFPTIITNLTKIAMSSAKDKNFPADASVTVLMESICKGRRSIFAQKDHTELALCYNSSSCTVLGISYCNDTMVKNIPHFTFSSRIKENGFVEPCFWTVSHTDNVNVLLDDLNKVIFEEISESEFFNIHPPFNEFDNWEHIIDREGFVTYAGKTYDYGKIKTDAYYIAHKLKAKNIFYLMRLASVESARLSFPLCNEVNTFYSTIKEDVIKLNDTFNSMCVDTESKLFKGLPEKAQKSFQKQSPQVRLKMLINGSEKFSEIAQEIFKTVYPFNIACVDSDFLNDVVTVVKSILMGFVENSISFDEPAKNPLFSNLFSVVRKSIQSL
ncbi:MAG: HD domain-containing protein [Candidatus Kapaibacteriota bacterium]